MKVVAISKVSKVERTGNFFTGGLVTAQELAQEMGNHFTMSQINFGKGSRTKWHTHSTYQLLVVTAGKGMVATEDEEIVVGVGDVVFFPEDEKHWHGATKDSEFSHLSIVPLPSKMTQLEK
jgi:quercetin dioxygenase-like cupin family protein